MKAIVKFIKNNKLLSIVVLTYLLLMIFLPMKAIDSSKSSFYYIKEMIQVMPIVFVLTALIEAWIPKDMIIKNFGENAGAKGALFSFVLGSFSAGPIYAAFPICKMLFKKGASVANIVIILSAWAVVKIPMLANEAKFLGSRFMMIRWVLTTIAILMMAYIVAIIVKKHEILMEDNVTKGEKSRIRIQGEYCVGCGLCEKLLPEYFTIIENKVILRQEATNDDIKESISIIMKKCPAKVIGYHYG
ncbi:putative permease [Clostridium aceticum]|uniref:Putative permease n=1 Tax=Clostridium aceticum TaxID=84022 RepID=A0A0D8IEH2_9CLOT|nr:permease [Clostridium aceticum]AKL96860.1 putative permease [Clostridium aceticum]KJF27601.1 permease [Clostridium aceticum]